MMVTSNIDLVFNVAQLLKEHVGATRKLELSTPSLRLSNSEGPDVEVEGGALEARDLRGIVKVTRLSDGLLVQGDVASDVRLVCSRCLDEFSLPVQAMLEEEYQPVIDVETGRPVQRTGIEENDQAFKLDANHQMDLTEPVRQALLVALPLKPLCREDCKGLCPECGANLNEGDCGHRPEVADNRWVGLRELRLEDFPSGENSQN
jgi:DUF177 domain-containing protein